MVAVMLSAVPVSAVIGENRQGAEISLRSYGRSGAAHSHGFAQLVLPLAGAMELEVAGRGGVLRRGTGACVAPGDRHDQQALAANRFLVVDLEGSALGAQRLERWADQPFLPLTPAAGHLVDYMGSLLAGGGGSAGQTALWLPLLLDALLPNTLSPNTLLSNALLQGQTAAVAPRLAGLLAALEADPFRGWSVAEMADRAALSPRRLHALFRQDLGATPQGWLAGLRLARVQHWLTATDLSVAEIAYRAGYADQSALTRALRRQTGLTPAAYRRQERSKLRQS